MSEEEKKQSYYQRNRERQLELAKKYREANKEKNKDYWKDYYVKNKTVLREKHKDYVRKNKDVINRKNRTVYYKRHQQKKKDEPMDPLPSVLSPTVEMPMWTMIVSPGDHLVTFE